MIYTSILPVTRAGSNVLPVNLKLRQEPDIRDPDYTGESVRVVRSGQRFVDITDKHSIHEKNQFLIFSSGSNFSLWQAPLQEYSKWKLIATVSVLPNHFRNYEFGGRALISSGPTNGELVVFKDKSLGLLIKGKYDNMSSAEGWYLYKVGLKSN